MEIYPNYCKVQRKFKFQYKHKGQFQQLGKSQAWLINTSIHSFSDLNSTVLQLIKRTVKLHLTKYIGSGSLKLKFLQQNWSQRTEIHNFEDTKFSVQTQYWRLHVPGVRVNCMKETRAQIPQNFRKLQNTQIVVWLCVLYWQAIQKKKKNQHISCLTISDPWIIWYVLAASVISSTGGHLWNSNTETWIAGKMKHRGYKKSTSVQEILQLIGSSRTDLVIWGDSAQGKMSS